MTRALTRPEALRDITEQVLWIADRNPEAARRFRAQVERTIEFLAAMPGVGVERRYRDPALAGLRMHPVREFPDRLIFYLPTREGIEVVRVLHAKRNIRRLFEGPLSDTAREGER
jgi:toxin ParE1/3/4